MKNLDIYLEFVQEGKVWDKAKKVWKDHKGKIITGAALAAATYAGHKALQDRANDPVRIADHKKESETEEARKKAAIDRIAKQRQGDDEPSKTSAAAYAVGKTAEIVTRPIRHAASWAADKAGEGIKAGASTAADAVASAVRNKYDEIKYKKDEPKPREQDGPIKALYHGLKGD